MVFGKKENVAYQQQVYGTWGTFHTPSGRVEYIQTKARIGATSKNLEKRLTGFLRPVREMLPTADMDFNQLLQRDLDDHRVATSLVPYVLENHGSGPAFLPPVVVAILPFDGKDPRPHFQPQENVARHDDRVPWKGYRFGSAFQFERMQDPEANEDYDIKLGRLSWNPEEARLVVIDGQHRAMALLAIDRTINNSWSENGEQYRYFYEHEIARILSMRSEEEREKIFDTIEFPVTILWFPDCNRPGTDHHQAARRLFVDVNKNARTPSESRLVLLSDTELLSIFTRRILNKLRSEGQTLPIYCVEYDHPGRDQASYSKWSVVSNVITIRDCVNRAVFGPQKYIDSVAVNFGGRESEFERSQLMRETLAIGEGISETEGDIKRDEISNENFPRGKLEFLNQQLMRGWGDFIVRMLSDLVPYAAHAAALDEMKKAWATADATDRLAKNAIFEGVGMFWTIRDSYQHWEHQNQLRSELKQPRLDKTDIVKTWEVIDKKREEFEERRAKEYLGKSDPAAVKEVNAAFDGGFATNACQVGLLLTARTLAMKADILVKDLFSFNYDLVVAVNLALEGGPKTLNGRRTIFWTGHEDALNRIPKLDSPYAVYFRYFWLELLCSEEAFGRLDGWVKKTELMKLRDRARLHYMQFLAKDLAKSIKRTNPNLAEKEIRKQANIAASDALRKALHRWFGLKKAEFEAWRREVESGAVTPPEALEETPELEASIAAPDLVTETGTASLSLDDLLKNEGAADQ